MQNCAVPDVSGPRRGPFYCVGCPQATQTFGLCALGLSQVKAIGLAVVFDHQVLPLIRVRPPVSNRSCPLIRVCSQTAVTLIRVFPPDMISVKKQLPAMDGGGQQFG